MSSDDIGEAIVKTSLNYYATWFRDSETLESGRISGHLRPYKALFSPIQINQLKIRNRIVMGPVGNVAMAEETGRPKAKMIAFLTERAKGGAGLITTGLIPVAPDKDPSLHEAGNRTILPLLNGSRSVLVGWRDLAQSIHAHGSRIFVQLTAGLGRVGSPECFRRNWRLPVSASWNKNFYVQEVLSRPLTDGECRTIIRAAGQAAANAKSCLIDGVYLHGHEGYLLDQMTNPAFNRRTLGAFSDWRAFGIEMVHEIRRRCGPDYPVMYRIDLSLALNESYGERLTSEPDLRKYAHERTVDETLAYMRSLAGAGVDMFDVDIGGYENWWLPHPPGPMPPAPYVPFAKRVKQYFAEHNVRSAAGHEMVVVAVGKLGYPDLAEQALRDGACDMVMLARPLLADPQWPNKVYAGRVDEIVPCIGDQEACVNEFIHGGHVQCAVNPRTGFEDEIPELPVLAVKRKRVAVIGAGPAGITCARHTAERGHDVTLLERCARIGGWLVAGSAPRIKFDVANYLSYLESSVARTSSEYALDVQLDTEATASELGAMEFDTIVCCTGSRPATPPIEGVDDSRVIHATDLLLASTVAERAEEIVIVGGGDVGCETAHMLCFEFGKRVTVLEMDTHFMRGTCTANRGYLIYHLDKGGVILWNCARVMRIGDGEISVCHNVSDTVPSPTAVWRPVLPENIENPFARKVRVEEIESNIRADLVVLATGMAADDSVYRSCIEVHAAPEIHNIGDSFAPGRIFEATKAGFATARAI